MTESLESLSTQVWVFIKVIQRQNESGDKYRSIQRGNYEVHDWQGLNCI